jgi:SAM-dependent methyltransferase
LVQLSSDPVPYYREVIRASAVSEEMKAFRRAQFAGFVRDCSLGGKKVIEIGCGRGEYLSLMQEAGVAAFGLEQSRESAAHCAGIGLKVSQGFVEDASCKLSGAPFDAFFILNFLEHLPDPNGTLSGIRNNLTDDGAGLVEVPNFDMILRNKLFSEFTCDHLFYFTQDTLRSTLALNGFDVVACNVEWHDYIISAVVRKRGKLDISHFSQYQARLKNEMDEYVRRFGRKRVAVWGAGHQALAVIALLNLADKIKYVVDSAPFKQGKFTPATHVPVVAPDRLAADPVDAVIVMAAAYSDEVAKIIRQRFNPKIRVAILRDFGLEEA